MRIKEQTDAVLRGVDAATNAVRAGDPIAKKPVYLDENEYEKHFISGWNLVVDEYEKGENVL
ncbi:hypothetical protein [Shewanella youngdeokensis]|uniref:Uncharacterized protein n=1 Tax=Shewanella youngdeokensis TaxID=2999068 RepID=A0ABZ0JTG5_9GAMM|nr:hypothetical protein RGE70_09510 [Shewanella sp. DAU334]